MTTLLYVLSLMGGFALYGLVCSWLYRKYGWNDAPTG
jgi:hypothetical protein